MRRTNSADLKTGFRAAALLAAAFSLGSLAGAADNEKPAPTHADVSYGPHERNVLDYWQAQSAKPAPLAVFIHGGGFERGNKAGIPAKALRELLGAGINVASIHYRFIEQAPLPAAHYDSRRAIQFLRSKAADWNIDKSRVAAFGSSAGAQISMYLAFHDDLAQPESADPIERESSRLTCVGTIGGQTTLDDEWWLKHIPGYTERHHDFLKRFGLSDRTAYLAAIADTSALPLVSANDPPIFMTYSMSPDAPVPEGEKAQGWKVHHVVFGVALKEKMDALGVESHLVYPGAEDKEYSDISQFLLAKLQGKSPAKKPTASQ